MRPMSESPPVILGSSMSGLLVSLALSRAGIDHVLVGGGPPAPIPRLGEALTDCASPELWRLYGSEFPDCFHLKSHISIMNGNFATLLQLANPRRSPERVNHFAPEGGDGKPGYPWLGEGLFHLDRIAFDRAIYDKALAQAQCRFVSARIRGVTVEDDRVVRVDLEGAEPIEKPRYVFDASRSLIPDALGMGETTLGPPQRVVFTHFRSAGVDTHPPQWWRHGTNLLRLDREFDGIDAMSWLIPIGRTLSVGLSFDARGEHGERDAGEVIELVQRAYYRRGLEFRRHYPEEFEPIQELRHTYFIRDRAWGRNWLVSGNGFVNIWFPSSAGLWTATAAAGLAPRLIERPELGARFEKYMRSLVSLHRLWDGLVRGPHFKSSAHVYHFISRGMHFIPRRIAHYLRILDEDHALWRRPIDWLLLGIAGLGSIFPPIMFAFGGLAIVRLRLEPDRRHMARRWPLYFHTQLSLVWNALNWLPQFLWGLVPRRALPPRTVTPPSS
jgi:hypothetical protein